ncbi:putative chemoreceptor McpE [Maritalea myrionectae]|uniref:Putative chemoreceptor McpE n=1 Tax=Maritalea myrionectae TaxID=454601 RepID=A0A2R4MHB0_9HYPH|nr:globin-coupled sensor protein [Maritalea myrionectae]AVX05323.1 putative chemoreceptor McpE [Maritalea myrionectae]
MSQDQDQVSIDERREMMELSADAAQRVAKAKDHILSHLPDALDRFYGKVATSPTLKSFFESDQMRQSARERQTTHWERIADGAWDEEFLRAGRKVGHVHAAIGLDLKYYVSGYALVAENLIKGVMLDMLAEGKGRKGRFGLGGKSNSDGADEVAQTVADMMKVLMLDMELAISSYVHQTRHETEMVNAEMQNVLSAAVNGDFEKRVDLEVQDPNLNALIQSTNQLMIELGDRLEEADDALFSMANADLTHRIQGNRNGAFERLQGNINAVSDQLSELVGKIQGTSRSLKSATGEILSGANDLADRSNRQAAAIQQTTATVKNMSRAVAENTSQAREAMQQADDVRRTAEEGGEVMGNASQAMERITESSSKISNIIGLIDDIAFQTNLLALNASVEAARAGEAGKGFAVVAVEVRRLAQSAAEASNEVKALIEQSAHEVNDGTKLVNRAAESLNVMLDAARKNNELMASVAQKSEEQSSSIEEISTAIMQIDEMTQHNSSLVEQTNAAIEQTEARSSELDNMVDVFKLTTGHEHKMSKAG